MSTLLDTEGSTVTTTITTTPSTAVSLGTGPTPAVSWLRFLSDDLMRAAESLREWKFNTDIAAWRSYNSVAWPVIPARVHGTGPALSSATDWDSAVVFNSARCLWDVLQRVSVPDRVGSVDATTDVALSETVIASWLRGFERDEAFEPIGIASVEASQPRYPHLAAILASGTLGHGNQPDPSQRRLRLLDADELDEADQVAFGRAGDPPAELHRRRYQ